MKVIQDFYLLKMHATNIFMKGTKVSQLIIFFSGFLMVQNNIGIIDKMEIVEGISQSIY